MKSPITGKEMKKMCENRTMEFRGEQYTAEYTYWLCEDTGERFTTAETDDEFYFAITGQYRAKYGIPSVDQIKEIKRKYNLTDAGLGQILGFGKNQIASYLDGEVPSKTNGRMLSALLDENVFNVFLNLSKNQLGEKKYNKIRERLQLV